MGDEWLAMDKAEHFLACMVITTAVASAAGAARRLRAWRTPLGAVAGLLCGAAKEAADATGFLWHSAGFSVRDGVADAAGVLAAVALDLIVVSRQRLRAEEAVGRLRPARPDRV